MTITKLLKTLLAAALFAYVYGHAADSSIVIAQEDGAQVAGFKLHGSVCAEKRPNPLRAGGEVGRGAEFVARAQRDDETTVSNGHGPADIRQPTQRSWCTRSRASAMSMAHLEFGWVRPARILGFA